VRKREIKKKLVEKLREEEPRGGPVRKCEDNIKMSLK
jgi:hypothetical protein